MAEAETRRFRRVADFNDPAIFDPVAYLKWMYCDTEDGKAFKGALRALNIQWLESFGKDGIQGERLLDFGCGPSINVAIAASQSFQEIYLADYAVQNRVVLEDWVDRKLGHDWKPFYKFAAERGEHGTTWQDIEDRVRRKVRKIIHCDATKDDILEPHQMAPFDCITASFCLEGTCEDDDAYMSLMKKFAVYLKPDGFLFIVGVFNQTFYSMGKEYFYTLSLSKELLLSSLEQAGFIDVDLTEYPNSWDDPSTCNLDLIFFMKARKSA